jgi:hypothetical protein
MSHDTTFVRNIKIVAFSLVGLSIAVGGLILLGVVSIASFFAVDSPVEVAGGSIYASVDILNGWTELKPNKLYAAGSTNKDWIKTEGLTEVITGNPAMSNTSALQNTGGWIVGISVKKNGGNQQHSISFCSDVVALPTPPVPPLPSSPPACVGTPLSGANSVYLQANGRAEWRKAGIHPLRHQLDFKNRQDNCDQDTDPESDCQKVMHIRIQTKNNVGNTNGVDYQCLTPGKCKITVGN